MRLACPPLVALSFALSACHPANTAPPVGTSTGAAPTSNSGGTPGTATSTTGAATPDGTPPPTLPTDPNAASAAAGDGSALGSAASAASR